MLTDHLRQHLFCPVILRGGCRYTYAESFSYFFVAEAFDGIEAKHCAVTRRHVAYHAVYGIGRDVVQ